MQKMAARAGLVLAFMVAVFLVPALIAEQNDEVHSVHVAAAGPLALGIALILAVYAAFLLAWKVLR